MSQKVDKIQDGPKKQRGNNRKSSFLGGDIIINGPFPPIYCLIRNISPTGCLLSFESDIEVPDHFELKLSNGDHHSCEVAWRAKSKMGVKFV